ncbi:MAG: hypothetical protein L0215_19845 [Gemmataceae bacterium]|nr:hypothetical protein [Gemmataceae bacterium]
MSADQPYQVVWSQTAMDAVKEMGRLAARTEDNQKLADDIARLNERLRIYPPPGELRKKRKSIEQYFALFARISLNIAVDTKRRLVMVRNCCATP